LRGPEIRRSARPRSRILGALNPRTFITTALEKSAQVEEVQKGAKHRDPSTTKLYDRRGYNPEKAVSFIAAGLRGVAATGASSVIAADR
jgi:hypothetical protein